MIDKKLYKRAIKDKKSRLQDKETIKLLDKNFEIKKSEFKSILIDKLHKIIKSKVSQGVVDQDGEILISKGEKITQKSLSNIQSFNHIPSYSWTKSSETNVLIKKGNSQLQSYYFEFRI